VEYTIETIEHLTEAASQLLKFAGNEKIFLFTGDMGAGKTTLIKSICSGLKVKDTVTSPTYSLVNEYEGAETTIYHFDFYRIKNEEEAFDMGFEEYVYSGNYCFIEWPEKIENLWTMTGVYYVPNLLLITRVVINLTL
jgi:tRNA threonylcarbamoyladenosine biosynthesis protein TsaE